MFSAVGKTSSGLIVVSGVYAFFETHGLPLSDIINELVCRQNMAPSWPHLVADMTKAGRPFDRSLEAALSAARDACCFNAQELEWFETVMRHDRFKAAVAAIQEE